MCIANENCLLLRKLIYNARWKTIPNKRYRMNNDVLPSKSHVRDLGLAVDSNQNCNLHISHIVRKARQRGNLILKCFHLEIQHCC